MRWKSKGSTAVNAPSLHTASPPLTSCNVTLRLQLGEGTRALSCRFLVKLDQSSASCSEEITSWMSGQQNSGNDVEVRQQRRPKRGLSLHCLADWATLTPLANNCWSGRHGKSTVIKGSASSLGKNKKAIVLAPPLASCVYYLKFPFPRVLQDGWQCLCLARHWRIPRSPPLPTSSRPFHEDEARVGSAVVFVGRPH